MKKKIKRSLLDARSSSSSTVAASTATASSSTSSSSSSSSSRKRRSISSHQTQKIISTFHALNKKLTQCLKTNDLEGAKNIQQRLDEIGGLDAYQKASLRGGDEKKGKGACGKYLVSVLMQERHHIFPDLWPTANKNGSGNDKKRKRKGTVSESDEQGLDDVDHDTGDGQKSLSNAKQKLNVLDVGAVDGTTYDRQSSWMQVTYIDLNPQNPGISKQDFFDRPRPNTDAEKFHIVCFSLVVNFVPDIEKRGEMLRRSNTFLHLNGILYLVVPLPCITNSRYMTHDRLTAIMTHFGFSQIHHHFSKKLAHFVYKKVKDVEIPSSDWEDVVPEEVGDDGDAKDEDELEPSNGAKKRKRKSEQPTQDHGARKKISQKKKVFPKIEVNPGGGRNNFSIVVKS
ncbi:hypothetical protein HDU97_005181 [Phlyctochytrium planicorne]|nr:hypothetical protein HDU97_005181 [Phlyctochytrium planicorne]